MIGDYTRVTEILYPFSSMQYVNKDVLERAAKRGTRVHKACEAIIEGLGDWDSDHEIQPYIDSFIKWWNPKIKVASIEQRFHDDELMITGAVDIIQQTKMGCIIVDLKTSQSPSKTWLLQGSAYSYMAKKAGYNVIGIEFIQLDKNGKDPRVHVFTENFELFRKTLDVYNYFFRKKNANTNHNDIL